MVEDIHKLLGIIEQKVDWGEGATWQTRDFEELSQRILNETGVSLSISTLRRLWGRVEYNHLPSTTTLDALAKFGGYDSWRDFTKSSPQAAVDVAGEQVAEIKATPQKKWLLSKKSWVVAATLLVLVVMGGVIGAFAFRKGQRAVDLSAYSFSSRLLTRTLPNSVVFTYDASTAPEDSIYIQQSWDPNTKTLVDKNLHQHTFVYYEPGYYDAKLIVGQKVVKQHRLMIPTDGWLGVINNKPVPVYLKQADYLHKDSISLPIAIVSQSNIPLQPQPPLIRFYNLGNFDTVPITDFSFTAQVKNKYSEGSSACQLAAVFLITDSDPVIIPVGVKGCSSEFDLLSVDQRISGKKADLSGFGVDFSKWATVSCNSTRTTIQYFVNGRLAFECPLPKNKTNIVGVEFAFQGTGAVKGINLTSAGKTIFKAF